MEVLIEKVKELPQAPVLVGPTIFLESIYKYKYLVRSISTDEYYSTSTSDYHVRLRRI